MMASSHYSRILLAERPTDNLTPTTFRREVLPLDLKPSGSQVLVQVLYVSIDPAMRGFLQERRGYMAAVQIGEVMRAYGLGIVTTAGDDSKFSQGDLVSGGFCWTEYIVMDDKDVTKIEIPEGGELLDFLGPLGLTGHTAFVGLLDIGKLQTGEVLVVSGAAGATGSLVCQIGKQRGAKVYALAGTADKCEWLEDEIGVDKAFNYKSPTFREDFVNIVGFLDVFFDNVGGEILDFALSRLNKNARIVLCGNISQWSTKSRGLTTHYNLILQRARMEGFIIFDHADRFAAAEAYFVELLKDGRLKRKYHVLEGLDKAPTALNMLLTGENRGKMVVKVAQSQ
ncbi:hypothetical protein AcW1_003145 [Taiwanofungus camphoratus]|nr:hypothetical protein AcV5_001663 [Antrodia cinnamomea]KAI0933197.1 hypothetical protein AcV7_004738 [Antrodia cinnamomea]KAI0942547.1 hypothetical protein AcW1_003145 [Antrodia cinnamomea]